ncbi:MAG: hypothetical protein RR620_12635 [Clostridium sp.]|uniref:hypothetical protein n=1 Tax=Anaerorhabdus sp. TaxID=1872524 RepID=UPI002FCC00AE
MLGCKLNRPAIEYLISQGNTTEISLLLYLSKLSNEFGAIRDIDYKETCEKLNISKQTFYNTLYRLDNNQIIQLDMFSNKINCTIVNNIFLRVKYQGAATEVQDDSEKGYLNTNIDFLYNERFLKAKLNVKRIVLMFLSAFKNKKDAYRVSMDTMVKRLGIKNKSLIWGYIDILKAWFNIDEKKAILCLTLLHIATKAKGFIKDIFLGHKFKNFCKGFKIQADEKSITDTITLIKIHGYKDCHLTYNRLIRSIIDTCLNHKKLVPALINATLQHRLRGVIKTE